MKTQEELNKLKQEYESLTVKLKELTEDELMMVTGGIEFNVPDNKRPNQYEQNIYTKENKEDAERKFFGQ